MTGQTTQSDSRLATAQDLEMATGVSAATWYGWAAEGRVPHYRFESAVRFDLEEVLTWARREIGALGKSAR